MRLQSRLSEIDTMRPIIIVLLILMHSFVIFSPSASTWPLPHGIRNVSAYHWIQELTYSFLLEAFTFISGYVYAYNFLFKQKNTFISLVKNKFKRLIVPSIIFSLLYAPLFYGKDIVFPRFLYDLICGIGHMWYLPMLFACFILTWVIQRINIPELYKLSMLLMLAILSVRLPGLFRINTICYYLFFFYFGFYMFTLRNKLRNYTKYLNSFCLWGGYLLILVSLILMRQNLTVIAGETCGYLSLIVKFSSKIIVILYSLIGTLTLFMTCLKCSKNHGTINSIQELNNYCMGLYLIHQFILKYLYYYTDLPKLGTYILPFVGFIITLTFSYFLVKYACKTRLGRFLFQ